MTPDRLTECMRLVRWSKDVLAEALDVPSDLVTGWLAGTEQVPARSAPGSRHCACVHEAAEETKPSTSGEGFGDGPRREFIPVYAYNLLRNLNIGPVLLKSLFGSDDEGAVFFLVFERSRDTRGSVPDHHRWRPGGWLHDHLAAAHEPRNSIA